MLFVGRNESNYLLDCFYVATRGRRQGQNTEFSPERSKQLHHLEKVELSVLIRVEVWSRLVLLYIIGSCWSDVACSKSHLAVGVFSRGSVRLVKNHTLDSRCGTDAAA